MTETVGDLAAAGSARGGSVPQPRGGEAAGERDRDLGGGVDAGGDGGDGGGGAVRGVSGGAADAFDGCGQTAARIRAGLADRLRTAHSQGRSLAELAAACRRPVAEIRALLAEGLAGVEAGSRAASESVSESASAYPSAFPSVSDTEPFVPLRAPAGERAVPVLRAAQAELRTVLSKRPSPSRRLRRMHPAATGPDRPQDSPGTEVAPSAFVLLPLTPHGSQTSDPLIDTVEPAAGDGTGGTAETPLGILIGGTPHLPEAVGRPDERQPVRVAAEPVRIGRGTSLVVLPAWRPAIAVSVSTDQLLSATGLTVDQLADAQLSVLINPGALHDRELDLHGWRSGRAGRRGGGQSS
ncbi:hypothetical protein [Kitasatospora sp. NPDC050463]|uniref:hypothetical protein n=1 Tax=Kitasatospora sp. NPDC050463 TaxID=3155786 RepID=UPI0033F63201